MGLLRGPSLTASQFKPPIGALLPAHKLVVAIMPSVHDEGALISGRGETKGWSNLWLGLIADRASWFAGKNAELNTKAIRRSAPVVGSCQRIHLSPTYQDG
jgi:hypothetical protein